MTTLRAQATIVGTPTSTSTAGNRSVVEFGGMAVDVTEALGQLLSAPMRIEAELRGDGQWHAIHLAPASDDIAPLDRRSPVSQASGIHQSPTGQPAAHTPVADQTSTAHKTHAGSPMQRGAVGVGGFSRFTVPSNRHQASPSSSAGPSSPGASRKPVAARQGLTPARRTPNAAAPSRTALSPNAFDPNDEDGGIPF
jgi:hypothetical protein